VTYVLGLCRGIWIPNQVGDDELGRLGMTRLTGWGMVEGRHTRLRSSTHSVLRHTRLRSSIHSVLRHTQLRSSIHSVLRHTRLRSSTHSVLRHTQLRSSIHSVLRHTRPRSGIQVSVANALVFSRRGATQSLRNKQCYPSDQANL